jgi:hypothetical protein
VLVGGLALGVAGCEGAARNACSTATDVAVKVTALTDDLNKAQASGKIDTLTAGDIAGEIMEAGGTHAADHRAYCRALDKIRQDAKL